MQRFAGKVAVVTGAGSGIGEATARRLAAEGATLVVADVDDARADSVAKSIADAGGSAEAVRVDVASRASVQAMVDGVFDVHGRLDILHNNAGVGSILPLAMLDDATIDRLIDINVKGVLYGLAIAGPRMVQAGGGSIVNTASLAAMFGAPMQVLYGGTKAAVVGLTKGAAMEFAPSVRVNAVCPGGVRTRFVEAAIGAAPPELFEGLAAKLHPLGRMADAAEVAAAVAYLASDDASFVTGTALMVDGGTLAGALIELS